MRTALSLVLVILVGGCDRPTSSGTKVAPSSPAITGPSTTLLSSPSAAAADASPLDASAAAGPATFDGEALGAPSGSFESIVGDWYVGEADGARGLEVDGSRWRSGTPSATLADQAKHLYGDRYAEFLDGVKAFAFFPFAIWKGEAPPGDLRISLRFYPIAGKIDQAAGIAFAIAPDGSYLGVRLNALEDNLLYFRVEKGQRKVIDNVRNVPTPTKVWHTLVLEVRGAGITVACDGQIRFQKTLDAPPRGRLGLWSKADSQVLFDDFTITSLGAP